MIWLVVCCSGLMMAAFTQTPPSLFRIEWNTNASTVTVSGTLPAGVVNLPADALQQVFPVTVEPAELRRALNLPPITGTYSLGSNSITFAPRFPFDAGVTYRATFTPGKTSSVLRIPHATAIPSTVVAEVYPTADILPQNLLKFYIQFSAPMIGGQIYEHIHLLGSDGVRVELPFLEIDEELWNPDMTRLTLFLDPGRIKRGVRPLEEAGPALLPGKRYTLRIDQNWLDASGIPLKQPFERTFLVVDPDREPPDPAKWRITAPKAGTREPLAIAFTDPMDHALALRMISVGAIAGEKRLEDNEKRWLFLPAEPWVKGRYLIEILTTIEDLAGNNIGKPFEVDLQQAAAKRPTAKTIGISFQAE